MDPSYFPSDEEQHLAHSSLGYGYPQALLQRANLSRRHTTQEDLDQRYLHLLSAHDRQWPLPAVAHSYPYPNGGWAEMSASVPSVSYAHQNAHMHAHAAASSLPDMHPHPTAPIHPIPSPVTPDRICPPLRQRTQRTGQACENCRGRKTKCSGTRPVCERCATRGLPCRYPESKAQARRREATATASDVPLSSASAPNLSVDQDLHASSCAPPVSEPATSSPPAAALAPSTYFSPPLPVPSMSPVDQSVIRYHYSSETPNLPAPLASSASNGTANASSSGQQWPSRLVPFKARISTDEMSPSGESSSSVDNISYLAASQMSERSSSLSSPHDTSPPPRSLRSPPLDAQRPQLYTRSNSTMPYPYGENPSATAPEDGNFTQSPWSSSDKGSQLKPDTSASDNAQWQMLPSGDQLGSLEGEDSY